MVKYRFGSEDSTDIDEIVIIDKLPTLEHQRELRKLNPGIDTNFAVVENRIITQCNIGTPDELNNALIDTYSLHEQTSDLIVTQRVERDIMLKVIRTTRYFLSILSRTPEYMEISRKAMKSTDWSKKLSILREVDYRTILLEGIEIYTKSRASEEYPELQDYLYYKSEDFSVLENSKNALVELIEKIPFTQSGDEIEFHGYGKYNLKYEKRI